MTQDQNAITVHFRDLDSDSDAFAIVRRIEGEIAFSMAVKADGGLDVVLDPRSAERIAHALLSACAGTEDKDAAGGLSGAG